MKTKKIIESLFKPAPSNRTAAMALLIGGVAVGATIGILFATERGKTIRQKISDTFASLFDDQKTNECLEPAVHSKDQYAGKRPKSDIKNIIHNAHTAAAHTEQSLN